MAFIHHTTLDPGKLDLIAPWLPAQPWFLGAGVPELAKAGGFRLDDPAGEVGIEFLVATDGPTAYHVPMTYRAAPLADADDALLGTTEHGVLGRRWVYDAAHDPVFVAALLALLRGETTAQQQSISDTPDDTVITRCAEFDQATGRPTVTASGAAGTDIRVGPALVLRVRRVLGTPVPDCVGSVTASWQATDGERQADAVVTLLAG
jgi:hypothetical protein